MFTTKKCHKVTQVQENKISKNEMLKWKQNKKNSEAKIPSPYYPLSLGSENKTFRSIRQKRCCINKKKKKRKFNL